MDKEKFEQVFKEVNAKLLAEYSSEEFQQKIRSSKSPNAFAMKLFLANLDYSSHLVHDVLSRLLETS